MISALDIRAGDVILLDEKEFQVLFQEVRGTGKFGKTIHLKLKNLQDGHIIERSLRGEDRVQDVEIRRVKMQYLYREGGSFIFMNLETFDPFPIPAAVVGRQEVFLKENTEIDVLFDADKPLNVDFPKSVELRVVSAPPQLRGQGTDTTYKEVRLENGLKILVPQFVKEGETVRVDTQNLSYIERVTIKSMKTSPGQTSSVKEKGPE